MATAFLCVEPAHSEADFGFRQISLRYTNEDGSPAVQAGSHPFAVTATVDLKTVGIGAGAMPDGELKDLDVRLPRGLIGTPSFLPHCTHSQLTKDACPRNTAIGTIELASRLEGEAIPMVVQAPIYNLEPLGGTASEFGIYLIAGGVELPLTVQVGISSEAPHRLVASLLDAPQILPIFGYQIVLWGDPGDPAHDPYRAKCGNAFDEGESFEPLSAGTCPLDEGPAASLLSLPTNCASETASFEATAWDQPVRATARTDVPGLQGCETLSFSPSLSAAPTTRHAGFASGLKVGLDYPDKGLRDPISRAGALINGVALSLPEGMGINPPFARDRAVCTPEQLVIQASLAPSGEGCPAGSRMGTANLVTPLVPTPVHGDLFIAEPDDPTTAAVGAENPFDSLFAIYLVLAEPQRGISIVQPIRLVPDPHTGRIQISLNDLPELPIEHLDLELDSGPRAPLTTPQSCGSHEFSYSLQPSSGNLPLDGSQSFATSDNCAERLRPRLAAVSSRSSAGSATDLDLTLSFSSYEPSPARVDLTLPAGLSASLAGVPRCPESAASVAACPAEARLGSLQAAIGAGPEPLSLPSDPGAETPIFLAGPYRGAPYSLLARLPAAAGPFDLGTVVLRAPVEVDSRTARATIRIERIPQILSGVPLRYRELRLELDRPGFLHNPTSCAPAAIIATLSATDGASATVASPFQTDDCAALPFRPRLSVSLSGALARNGRPALRAVIRAKPHQANIARAALALPVTELLEYEGIRGVCAKSRYAAAGGDGERCPSSSRYGRARVFTPLLDRPLEGPIYLRANRDPRRLPELVASLSGPTHLDFVARVSSAHGLLNVAFGRLPDLPIEKVVLGLHGGRRGLLVNTSGLCRSRPRVRASFLAHNRKRQAARPAVNLRCAAARANGGA